MDTWKLVASQLAEAYPFGSFPTSWTSHPTNNYVFAPGVVYMSDLDEWSAQFNEGSDDVTTTCDGLKWSPWESTFVRLCSCVPP